MSRLNAEKLLEMCQDGVLDSYKVLENVLMNYMSSNEADDFARSEYDIDED